jgi:hypothetical protein
MRHFLLLPPFLGVLGILLLLSGCLYDQPPSGPSCDIDTWLVGQWQTTDKSGHDYTAVMSRTSSDHYHLQLSRTGAEMLEFDSWISRVDGFSILVVKSLNEGASFGKCSLYHYELLAPSKPLPGGIGAPRIRVSELQLDESCRSLDSYNLRKAIRSGLKKGTLLVPHNVVADLKSKKVEIPGSVVWTRTGGVTLRGETF